MSARPAIVDLISDTATRPTPGMYEAMQSAPLGDEQKGEDPSVNALQERAAALLGTERSLFLPTASMANQIALALHCGPGDEVLCHPTAHVRNHETGGTAVHARAQINCIEGERGHFSGDDVRAHLRVDDPHYPDTRVVVVENTSNGGGGALWPDALFDSVADACDELDIALHIDGARLMNAAVKAGVEPSRWGARAKTVQMCFSKGLGCPFGAVLGLSEAQWRPARRWKQRLGGALRQAGVIAGAMSYALDHNVEKLAEDHRRAARLAEGLAELDGISVEPADTNLVYFQVEPEGLDAAAFCERLLGHDVRMGAVGARRVRACLHLDVDDAGVEQALTAAKAALEM
jgi:threonine aldolase